jgi:hypothetical protein
LLAADEQAFSAVVNRFPGPRPPQAPLELAGAALSDEVGPAAAAADDDEGEAELGGDAMDGAKDT